MEEDNIAVRSSSVEVNDTSINLAVTDINRGNSQYNIRYEKEVTIDYILDEADKIWKKYGGKYDQLDDLYKEYTDFYKAYPIVAKFILEGIYSSRALKMYLKKIKQLPWNDEESYLDSQADYVKFLYMKTTSQYNTAEAKRIWEQTRACLSKERDDFKNKLKIATEKVEMLENERVNKSKEELSYFYKIATNLDNTVMDINSDVKQGNIPQFNNILEKFKY